MEWISIKERFPEERSRVYAFHNGIVDTKVYEKGVFYNGEVKNYIALGRISDVTHWMYIPERPERLSELASKEDAKV